MGILDTTSPLTSRLVEIANQSMAQSVHARGQLLNYLPEIRRTPELLVHFEEESVALFSYFASRDFLTTAALMHHVTDYAAHDANVARAYVDHTLAVLPELARVSEYAGLQAVRSLTGLVGRSPAAAEAFDRLAERAAESVAVTFPFISEALRATQQARPRTACAMVA